MTPAPASIFAVELLGELIRRGVSDMVVCPGSRSQALALAAAASERAGAIRLHVRVDERSAAFFALGVARETGMPAPVIVTSGTAVANLAPAVLEAHEGRVPLLLLTADRPEELRGIRSNQATRQAGMFGPVTRLSLDVPAPGPSPAMADAGTERNAPGPSALAASALTAALGAPAALPAGPVHLNLAFREPLSGTQGFDRMIADGFRAAAEERDEAPKTGRRAAGGAHRPRSGGLRSEQERADVYLHTDSAGTVVIAGADAGPEAVRFAREAGLPLLAEAVSGARVGAAIPNYAELLDAPEHGASIRRAVVFGHPTLTRQVPALLRRTDVEVVVVDPHEGADHYDPSRTARVVREARIADDFEPDAAAEWRTAWRLAATGGPEAAESSGPDPAPLTREALALAVWHATASDDRLVLAASRLVRVLDRVAPPRDVHVHANRGLAGIDGTVATALGVAAAADGAVTRVLLGDLALLHDAGSLLLPPGEPRPNVQLIVGNDGGGTIFDGLEVAGSADPEAYARVMTTPQRVELAALATAYGWTHLRVETPAALEAALARATGPALIEVPLSR